jgi:hypothetical protein
MKINLCTNMCTKRRCLEKNDVIVPSNVTVCYHSSAFQRLLVIIYELQWAGAPEVSIRTEDAIRQLVLIQKRESKVQQS